MPHARAPRAGLAAASLTAAASVLFGSALLLSETPPARSIVYTSSLPAPSGTTPRDFSPPPTDAQWADALFAAQTAVLAGDIEARARVPEVPWNEHGLARVAIASDAIAWDAGRGRYIAALPDGRTAILTLDRAVQSRLQSAVDSYDEPGEAAVVIDPETGAVLGIVDDGAAEIGDGLARRATAFAASTFKVITGAALLGEGVASPTTVECYSGGGSGFDLSDLVRREGDETCVTLTEAMARSANIVFGRLAHINLNGDVLRSYAEGFGFNTTIPFEMSLERSHIEVPEDELEFARLAAGFRHSWMSPLHGALIQAAIANDGVMMVPTIVASIEDPDGAEVYHHRPVEWRRVLPSDVNAALVQTLSETCTSGTARSYFAQRDGWPTTVRAWGKTGTLSNRAADGTEADTYYLYTWFTGFGVTDDGASAAASGLVANTPTWWIKGGFLASEGLLAALQ